MHAATEPKGNYLRRVSKHRNPLGTQGRTPELELLYRQALAGFPNQRDGYFTLFGQGGMIQLIE